MKNLFLPLLLSLLIMSSCSSFDSDMERQFKANKAYIEQYTEKIGFANNPFLVIIPEEKLDNQRKKYIASLSETDLENLVDNSTSGVPKIETETERGKAFLREVKRIKDPSEKYAILVDKYPDIILE